MSSSRVRMTARCLFLAFASIPAWAHAQVPGELKLALDRAIEVAPDQASTIQGVDRDRPGQAVLDQRRVDVYAELRSQLLLLKMDSGRSHRAFADGLERQRVDHQVSVAGGASGAATRAGLGNLIDLAVESGAVTRTFDQNVITLRANAAGVGRFLTNQPILASAPASNWNGFELSATFDAGNGATDSMRGTLEGGTEVEFTPSVSDGTFTSAGFRWSSDSGNARTAKNQQARQDYVSTATRSFARSRTNDTSCLPAVGMTRSKLEALSTALEQGGRVELDRAIEDAGLTVDCVALAEEHLVASARVAGEKAAPQSGWQYAFEGKYETPAQKPKMYSGVMAISWTPKPCDSCDAGKFTLNAGASVYVDPQPTGQGTETERMRNVTAALQFDRTVGKESPVKLSLGGYSQWQVAPGIIEFKKDAKVIPGTTIAIPEGGLKILGEKGWLGVVQAALEFALPGGLKAPLSVTYSNRSEFNNKPDVKAFLGVLLSTGTQ